MGFIVQYRHTIIAIALCGLAWWFLSPQSPRVFLPEYLEDGVNCSYIGSNAGDNGPSETAVPASMQPLVLSNLKMTPVKGYTVSARVLQRTRYLYDDLAKISTFDWIIGWDFMGNKKALTRLKYTLKNRSFVIERGKGGFLDYSPNDLVHHLTNVHLIPANKSIASKINKIGVGDNVRLEGWLVNLETPDWTQDTGTMQKVGSEILLVCRVVPLSSQKVWPNFK